MNFSDPLIRGRFVERYKRFLSTIELDGGESITAHCPNPGSMAGLLVPSGEVWLSPSRNPKRKLRYTWELVCINGGYVGINTLLANRIVEEGLNAKKIRELADYSSIRREVRYGKNSRVDFLLEAPEKPPCYVEVKSVTLRLGESAAFPDAVTARGTKHLSELTEVVRSGKRAVIFYLVQREDCNDFVLAEKIDRAYAEAMWEAKKVGVEAICFTCKVSVQAIKMDRPLSFPF